MAAKKNPTSALLALDAVPEFAREGSIREFWEKLLEIALLFYELTAARHDFLGSLEPAAVRALDFSRNWVATTSSVSEPPSDDEGVG